MKGATTFFNSEKALNSELSRSLVRTKLNEAGVDDFNYKNVPNPWLVRKIIQLRERGLSYQKIADKFNILKIE